MGSLRELRLDRAMTRHHDPHPPSRSSSAAGQDRPPRRPAPRRPGAPRPQGLALDHARHSTGTRRHVATARSTAWRGLRTFQPDLAVPGAAETIAEFGRAARDRPRPARAALGPRRARGAAMRGDLLGSGIGTTVVRCSFFAQNFSEHFLLGAVLDGVIALPAARSASPSSMPTTSPTSSSAASPSRGTAARLRAHRAAAAVVRRHRHDAERGHRPPDHHQDVTPDE